jgi:hypothetical protein
MAVTGCAPGNEPRVCGKTVTAFGPGTDAGETGARNPLAMYARAVDDAAARLRELCHEQWEQCGLAALALGLAVTASQVLPPLAVPLLLGGLALGALGMRAFWRHWDLLDRLAGERDAHGIPAVAAYASREATLERRRSAAATIRRRLTERELGCDVPFTAVAKELEALAAELDDGELAFEPAAAVACTRLLSDPSGGDLLDPASRPDELRSRVRQIRSGLRPRDLR